MNVRNPALRVAITLLMVTTFSACLSARRTDLDLEVPPAETVTGDRGAIVIVAVEDGRTFVDSARTDEDAAPHQLHEGGVGDPRITERAFGQMRGNNGSVLHDFVLPNGRTVMDVTRESLGRGFEAAGYRVLDAADPAADEAIRVSALVRRFWSWNTGGAWSFTFFFESEVALSGDAPWLSTSDPVTGGIKLRSAVGTTPQSFANTTRKGLQDFIENVTARASAPR